MSGRDDMSAHLSMSGRGDMSARLSMSGRGKGEILLHFRGNCATMGVMNVVRANGYAKLNLTLDVTGKQDGYHTLDSLVVTIGLCDRLVLKKRKDRASSVTMHGMGSEVIPPDGNNALRAAEAFSEAFGTCGADVTVYKNIPMGAGLGGSSADAAAVLLGMKKLYGVADMGGLKSLADSLGSDTGFLLFGGLARMQGRGDVLLPLNAELEMHFLVICPDEGVSSGECYGAFDRLGEHFSPVTPDAAALLERGDLPHAARYFSNRLYGAAKSLVPAAEQAYLAAKSFSPLGAAMTGSGSAAFALFETKELAEWAKSRYRGKGRAFVTESVYPKNIKPIGNPYALSEGEGEGE